MNKFAVQLQIFLGTLILTATVILLLVYGLREEERMAETRLAVRARQIEEGADLFEQQCSRCHGTQGTGIPGLCPPLNDRYFFDQRLSEIAWSGTMEDYIVSTASSGRLTSTRPELYPGQGVPAMPSFADNFGGPLREDQIRSIAIYIMNWEETAEEILPPPTPSGPVVGTDISKELPEGDPQNGEALANSLGCVACHITAPTGPSWQASADQPGIGERADLRLQEASYTGNAANAQEYLFEAIVLPNAYLVSGFAEGVMPNTYANSLTDQDMADLIAYLLTLK